MINFFNSQYDYIYFFYGLSFFILALICFSQERAKLRKLPWTLLGLFGLLHGINEWLEIYAFNAGTNLALTLVHILILGISYVFFFEFGRIGLFRVKNKLLSPRVYFIIAVLVSLGLISGLNGLRAYMRYFLGFPAGIFSAFVIYQASKSERQERKPLIALSISLLLYAFMSGLFVAKAPFFPADRFNSELFLHVTGFPVQIIRAILALSSAMSIWVYSQTVPGIKYRTEKSLFHFKDSKWIIMFTLVILIGLGWVFTNYLDYYAGVQIIRNSKAIKNSPLNQLVRELTRLENVAKSISRSSEIKAVLTIPATQDMEKANILLIKYKDRFGALECFLLDARGVLVATTESGTGEMVLGKTYVSKPYFKQAMSGDTGYYFVMGSKYDERYYYVGYPVKDASNKISGIAVIKDDISVEPILQYRMISIAITLFVCILTIIFFIVLGKRESLIRLIEEANIQLQTVDKMKTDFISIVSHELRTPLTAIKNSAAILLKGSPGKGPVDPQKKELLEIILKNTNRQTRMISDLLDVSKIEAGVMDIFMEPQDIVALAGEAVDSFQSQAGEKAIVLSFSKGTEPVLVYIDAEHTRRVLSNLISNAIKFTSENGSIKVKLKEYSKHIRVTVSDTGIGISQQDQGRLFNKFYRAGDVRSHQKGGSGLGLVISKGLVEAQGGRIWVESEPGKGSSFHFTVKIASKELLESRGKQDAKDTIS